MFCDVGDLVCGNKEIMMNDDNLESNLQLPSLLKTHYIACWI